MNETPESGPPDFLEETEVNDTTETLDQAADLLKYEEEDEEEDDVPAIRRARFDALGEDTDSNKEGQQLGVLMDLPLVISIELGRTRMPAKEFINLGKGSVISLDKLAGEPVDVMVNDRKFAEAEVVVLDENFGIRITRLLERTIALND